MKYVATSKMTTGMMNLRRGSIEEECHNIYIEWKTFANTTIVLQSIVACLF